MTTRFMDLTHAPNGNIGVRCVEAFGRMVILSGTDAETERDERTVMRLHDAARLDAIAAIRRAVKIVRDYERHAHTARTRGRYEDAAMWSESAAAVRLAIRLALVERDA